MLHHVMKLALGRIGGFSSCRTTMVMFTFFTSAGDALRYTITGPAFHL
jgi:hypothetical protein